MLQNHFVNLSQKRSDQLNEIQVTRKQLSIIKQKSLKIDQDLEISQGKAKDLQICIKKFTSKLELLNEKIYKKRIHHDFEETQFQHEQAEYAQKLKFAEFGILKLEETINDLQNEIELYKDFVIDSHRKTLSWETKYKLLEETIHWSKIDRSVKSEIGLMKTEIHRMNIRYEQLKRAQESLVLDLEHCVMHREQIFVNASVKEYVKTKFTNIKNSSQIQLRLDEVHNRTKLIKNAIQLLSEKNLIDDINKIERMIYMIRRIQADLNDIIKDDANILDRIEEGVLSKHANLEQIIRKQMRAKAFRKLNILKSQQKIGRAEVTVQLISQKQSELNFTLQKIVQTLLENFPDKKTFFTKVLHVLKD
ncbi:coiled-coil domain-containing protein 40-like [Drosophila eugracilis]|uniref:coiled-coil domain-containing protein 40-like n=1 Tax=Drosophila eugracilis TaxID=29029 RepID=UPI001BDA4EB6|nr:coiled-coil domain-containing protein 40-like [Drosophila eugracilis]